ncbi:MAG TPA: DUF1028 domain-containing protein [Actinomycetota bacterium]|nr:DUF1028 domain-containing protein [Actinomycetota bacterium]
MTFSICAFDDRVPDAPEWGVAVASKFLAVGGVVPWARAEVGAVATQAFANVTYGPRGLDLLASGASAEDVVSALTSADEGRADRQVGIVDARGRAASFTGESCFAWAGGRTGKGYCCQGNILTGADVVDAMAAAFESSEAPLPQRLLAALEAGDRAGGDSRGRQSAALLVVRAGGDYVSDTDVAVDLRVDDHTEPIPELDRLLGLHELLFPAPGTLEFVPIDAGIAHRVRARLAEYGYDTGTGEAYDAELKAALWAYVGRENLESRWTDAPQIERAVLDQLLGPR